MGLAKKADTVPFGRSYISITRVRPLIPQPERLKPLPAAVKSDDIGRIPTLEELVKDHSTTADARTAFPFHGGESAALERINRYLWGTNHFARYKEMRNGLNGSDYSTKLSPWLAVGAISPCKVFDCVKRYENERTANQSTYWVIFKLLWWDYFQFVSFKYERFYLLLVWHNEEKRVDMEARHYCL